MTSYSKEKERVRIRNDGEEKMGENIPGEFCFLITVLGVFICIKPTTVLSYPLGENFYHSGFTNKCFEIK